MRSDRGAELTIHVAFRFHVNFYHSYRGDRPDESGFGKDIRIIRGIVDHLDSLNERGIPVRGTWDFDNLFSLETIIPVHAPDLIDSWKRRVGTGIDEINLMSYNNGLVSAHTVEEFDAVLERTVRNRAGSGLSDLFPTVRPIVRPQEMMYTPAHLRLYRAHGVEAISLFYSSAPFNAFSNFVPTLSLEQRHNPLTLRYPGIDETMTLLPAYNHGDIADHLSLRRWLLRLNRRYRRMLVEGEAHANELLVLIDLDADDDFWHGVDIPIVQSLLSTSRGLVGIVESIAPLPFVRFTTPWTYLEAHEPIGSVEIRQDTADGGFDGYSAWAEKWSNHLVWSGIERSRYLARATRRVGVDATGAEVARAEKLLETSFEARIKALSTTHFGLSMPVMNVHRLESAKQLVAAALSNARAAFDAVRGAVSDCGGSSDVTVYDVRPRRDDGETSSEGEVPGRARLSLRYRDGRRIDLVVSRCRGEKHVHSLTEPHPEKATPYDRGDSIGNGLIEVRFDPSGHPQIVQSDGSPVLGTAGIGSSVRFAGRVHRVRRFEPIDPIRPSSATVVTKRFRGVLRLPVGGASSDTRPTENDCVVVTRDFTIVAGLPSLYLKTTVRYPSTDRGRGTKASRRLGRTFDRQWQEVAPCEITLPQTHRGVVYRIWKHNYLDHVSSYDLDYHRHASSDGPPHRFPRRRNVNLDSVNNHITNSWVAFSDQSRGILVAQTLRFTTCFAFCPLRTRLRRGRQELRLNPFGAYSGRQLSYRTATTGIGKLGALLLAGHLTSAAPSYSGREETFELMIAPYRGDRPPEQIIADAEVFTSPPIVLGSEIDPDEDDR